MSQEGEEEEEGNEVHLGLPCGRQKPVKFVTKTQSKRRENSASSKSTLDSRLISRIFKQFIMLTVMLTENGYEEMNEFVQLFLYRFAWQT